jgi:hypothetical protein
MTYPGQGVREKAGRGWEPPGLQPATENHPQRRSVTGLHAEQGKIPTIQSGIFAAKRRGCIEYFIESSPLLNVWEIAIDKR